MESQPKDPQAAIEGAGYYMANRRILEFFLLAALIGIGVPVAILMGVRSGEKAAAELYPPEEGAVMSPWPGMRLADADAPAFRKAWSVD